MEPLKSAVLMKKGAEANIYVGDWHGRRVVFKKRLKKEYRHEELDGQIRLYRTLHEPQLMHSARRGGVPTPTIFLVDTKNTTIIMEYVEGRQVKHVLNEASDQHRWELCQRIGKQVALLHGSDIIHGDLTTSNMIVSDDGRIFFLDFGLGEMNVELEAKGVDLHLMKRALDSTHYRFSHDCFLHVIKGYEKVSGSQGLEDVLSKIREIERRGRYVAERKEERL